MTVTRVSTDAEAVTNYNISIIEIIRNEIKKISDRKRSENYVLIEQVVVDRIVI